jgi:hypothetical protein
MYEEEERRVETEERNRTKRQRGVWGGRDETERET